MRRTIISLSKFLFVVFVVSGLCVASLPLPAMAEPPTPTPPHPRPHYEGLEEWPYRAPTTLQTSPHQENVTSAQFVPWSKLVFQSYRDDNWEIYLANGDGSNQTRLTNHSASDIYPRLNRGCTRIAFASNRTGNYEIFTMNPDGSGLWQLTANSADDGNPSWSPDGTRIAFEAYRDGQAEIYVMNADGSGQTRLTWDGAYDGMPAWSPGGTRIAFTSRRSGGYAIWVMNADGSGQMQLSWQPYSEHPAWSPDGTQIAYDADGDGDGWQELWLMNADGSNQRQVYDPGGYQTDAWAKSWSPDGRYVAFARISWIYYEGNLYWTEAYLDAWDSVNPWSTIRLSSQGTDWQPDWQTTDAWAPTSRVNALPSYARNGILVSWGGSDLGGSGIKTYDVQYRDIAGGSWTDWQMGTTQAAASFCGTAGHTYCFRSRSRDSAQNVENWPSGDGDTCTTLYTWGVAGTVRDNAGTPVVGAMVTTTPGAFYSVSSDVNGAYAAYVVANSPTYTITWAKSGYGDLPAAGFAAAQDAHVNVVLPPNDNVVRNWGFESGNLGPGDWLASGIVMPVVTSNVKHTGSYAALIGQKEFAFAPATNVFNNAGESSNPQLAVDAGGAVHVVWGDTTIFYAKRSSDGIWSGPQNISDNSGWSGYPQLAVDAGGAVHVVWQDSAPGNYNIFYARRSSDGIWSGPQNISNNSDDSWQPQLAVDAGGAVHVVWIHATRVKYDIFYDIFYARRSSDGAWSGPQNISNDSGYSWQPQLAVDAGGAVHVVWSDSTPGNYNIFYAKRSSDGIWLGPQNISDNSGWSGYPQLAVDAGGAVHVVWQDSAPGNYNIFYARRSSDGIWSGPQNISNNSGDSWQPQLAVDAGGAVHVVWSDSTPGNSDIFYAKRSSDGIWSGPQNISDDSGWSAKPQLAVDADGAVHVVWGDTTIFYAKRSSDGIWSGPQNISDDSGWSGYPQLAVDAGGAVHVVWSSTVPGDYDILYVGPATIEQTCDFSITQAITVPITMSTPTLSFLYQLNGASPTSGSWFNVQVDNGITATTLFSTTANIDAWTHRWFGLTTWAGQAITLTFNLHQTAGYPYAWAYLDEVTLGSAYPDLWVSKSSPDARPGEQVIYAITYGNRGGAPASGVRIADTLPAELSFIDASLPPVTTLPLVWEVGDVPAKSGPFTIAVTATVDPAAPLFTTLTNTASIGAVSPELETFNNTAQAATFIGHRIYLPVVMKGYFE